MQQALSDAHPKAFTVTPISAQTNVGRVAAVEVVDPGRDEFGITRETSIVVQWVNTETD